MSFHRAFNLDNSLLIFRFYLSTDSNNGLSNATLFDPKSKADIGKGLVQDGFILVEKRPGRRFAKFVSGLKTYVL